MPQTDLISSALSSLDTVSTEAYNRRKKREKKQKQTTQQNNIKQSKKQSDIVNRIIESDKLPSFDSFSSLGAETVPYGGSTRFEDFHPAIDIANKIGTKVPSYSGGKVIDVREDQGPNSEGYGNYAIVKDPEGNVLRYSHLNDVYVQRGQKIAPGVPLGEMGNTGSTYSTSGGTGSHLDLRIKNAYDDYVNPKKYLQRYAR